MSFPTRPAALIALLDPTRDRGRKENRWDRWRPTIALAAHPDLIIARFDLLHDEADARLARTVAADILRLAPAATIETHCLRCAPSVEYASAYADVAEWVARQPFAPEAEPVILHTGREASPAALALWTHAHSGAIPGRLALVEPPEVGDSTARVSFVELAESPLEQPPSPVSADRLPSRNAGMSALLDHIEKVSSRTGDPVVLHGAPGAGRTTVARWIHAIRRAAGRAPGNCIEVDGIEIASDARRALFGHKRLAGALAEARRGTLIIEHIDALPAPEQIALARKLDRAGVDAPGLVATLAGPLTAALAAGSLQEDLLAVLDGWVFEVPALSQRVEDLAPAVEAALDEARRDLGRDARFEDEALARFLGFAGSPDTHWAAGFRSLRASVRRMATLADDGLIDRGAVDEELARLSGQPVSSVPAVGDENELERLLGSSQFEGLDRFDRVQLADVVAVCRQTESLSEAGRVLFSESRQRRKTVNDADRVRKYLLRFGLTFDQL